MMINNYNEFINFLNSYNKNAGEYTKEEIYQIGVVFKQMPNQFKNWDDLALRLGYSSGGEALRGYIKRQQAKNGVLQSNEKIISGKSLSQLNTEELSDEVKDQISKLKIQEIKNKDIKNAINQKIRDEARIDEFKDNVYIAISNLDQLPQVKFKQTKYKENKEAILLFSDLHIGAIVDSFHNKYNVNIARQRVQKLIQDVKEYCLLNQVQRLTVLNLGDLIDGNIHITTRIEHTENVVEQCIIASEILANMLNELQEVAPELIYRSCTDNHSRITSDKTQSIEAENFGRLIDFYLVARLKDTKVKIINDNLDYDIGMFKTLDNKNVVFVHGHRDKNLQRTILGINQVLNKRIDYLLLGHLHSNSIKEIQGTTVITNGSVMGSNDYASSLRLYGSPQQTLIVFDKNNVINYSIIMK